MYIGKAIMAVSYSTNMTDAVLVTIASTTYNMEAFIAEALDSWLAQETSFPFEILVSDDGSTDGTCDVVREYMARYPNITLISTGHIGKMPNFLRSLKESKGKYVALCDGDDYWIDTHKLQKQFDFMEAHPDFSECFTNSYVLDVVTGEKKIAKTQIWDVADTEGLLAHRDNDNVQMSPGHTSTFFYRNQFLQEYPKWMYGDVMTDFPLYMLLSRYGKAKFINEITSVYRHRPDGVSSKGWNSVRANERRIFVYENVNRDLGYKYKKIINPILANYYYNLGKRLYKNGRKARGFAALLNAFWYSPAVIKQHSLFNH